MQFRSRRAGPRSLILVGLIISIGALVAISAIFSFREKNFSVDRHQLEFPILLQENDPTGLTDEAFRLVSAVHPVHVDGSRVFIRNNVTGEVTVVNLASGEVRHVSPQSDYGDVILDDNTVMDVGSGDPHGYWPWLSSWWSKGNQPMRTWRRTNGVHVNADNPIRLGDGEVEVFNGGTRAYTLFDTSNTSAVQVQHWLPDDSDLLNGPSMLPRDDAYFNQIYGGEFSAHGPAGGGAAAAAADAPVRESPAAAEFRRHMAAFRRHIADPEESWHAAMRIYSMYPDPSGNIGIDGPPAAAAAASASAPPAVPPAAE